MDKNIELYTSEGETVSLRLVCEWWIEKYPRDVFVNVPPKICKIRSLMEEILEGLNTARTAKEQLARVKTISEKAKRSLAEHEKNYSFCFHERLIEKETMKE